ncbi:UNVERIFIED_CONTAM: hypothetical protein HDU68_003237 [Siphonaria sp. JEL0065]|nr:hypothetical protein HDU68_003237 [Siphonaria sp. JEL0065]
MRYLIVVAIDSVFSSSFIWSSSEFIGYTSYFTPLLLIVTALVSIVVFRKSVTIKTWFSITLISAAPIVYQYANLRPVHNLHNSRSASPLVQLWGVLLLLFGTLLSAIGYTFQEHVLGSCKINLFQVMFYVNAASFVLDALGGLVNLDQNMLTSIILLMNQPHAMLEVLLNSFVSTLAQCLMFYTVQRFGAIFFVSFHISHRIVRALKYVFIHNSPLTSLETLTPLKIFAFFLTAAGILVACLCPKKGTTTPSRRNENKKEEREHLLSFQEPNTQQEQEQSTCYPSKKLLFILLTLLFTIRLNEPSFLESQYLPPILSTSTFPATIKSLQIIDSSTIRNQVSFNVIQISSSATISEIMVSTSLQSNSQAVLDNSKISSVLFVDGTTLVINASIVDQHPATMTTHVNITFPEGYIGLADFSVGMDVVVLVWEVSAPRIEGQFNVVAKQYGSVVIEGDDVTIGSMNCTMVHKGFVRVRDVRVEGSVFVGVGGGGHVEGNWTGVFGGVFVEKGEEGNVTVSLSAAGDGEGVVEQRVKVVDGTLVKGN